MSEFNPVGVWEPRYKGISSPQIYGDEASYRVASYFLDHPWTVEDWGCGLAYARRFFKKANYVGIDGSKSEMCDEVDDLVSRNSSPDAILMRHVLEHNLRWASVIRNAIRCARSRIAIVFFSSFRDTTSYEFDSDGIPCISFSKTEVLSEIPGVSPVEVVSGSDTIWFIEKA